MHIYRWVSFTSFRHRFWLLLLRCDDSVRFTNQSAAPRIETPRPIANLSGCREVQLEHSELYAVWC